MAKERTNETDTVVTEPSLQQYLADIRSIPLLSREEEVELAKRIRTGDAQAREKLVSSNLRFVVSVAKHYQHQGLALTDLIAEGNVGLLKAAQRFDETRGFKFISYAVWWIRQALSQQTRPLRLPTSRLSQVLKLEKASERLEQKRLGSVTLGEVSDSLDENVRSLEQTLAMVPRGNSLDAVAGDKEGRLLDVLPDTSAAPTDENLYDTACHDEIEDALGVLDERERRIMVLFFGLYGHTRHTLEQIGVEFKLTRERVRQLKDRGLRKLRSFKRSSVLREYLTV